MAVDQQELIDDLEKQGQQTLDLDKTGDDDKDETIKADDREDTDDKEDKSSKEEKGDIPYGALKKEREKWQRRMGDMEEKLAKYDQLEQKLNQFYESQQSKDNQSRVPDYDENPAEYLRFRQEELEKSQQKLSEGISEQEKYREQTEKQQELVQAIQADETRFLKEKPDYYKALNLVMEKEMEKIQIAGHEGAKAQKILMGQILQTASDKIDQHDSPAEFIYNLAKFYGYKTEEASKAEDKIDQLEEGMKASKNLGSGNKPKLDELDKMPLTEFDQAMKEMFG